MLIAYEYLSNQNDIDLVSCMMIDSYMTRVSKLEQTSSFEAACMAWATVAACMVKERAVECSLTLITAFAFTSTSVCWLILIS